MSNTNKSLAGEAHPVAGLVCLFGFFLHIILSDPLLNALGFHYSGEEQHAFYERIHPGTVFIFISFLILLWDRGNPIRTLLQMTRCYPAFVALLLTYIFILVYMLLRNGTEGTGFIVDTHMTVPICALVLSYTPLSYCRRAVAFFLAVAALNSTIGIVEGMWKFRIFTFDADWVVNKEKYFRASALRGHPLVNAMFSSIALFVALAMPLSRLFKITLMLLFTASLIAFGSRSSLIFTVTGLAILGAKAFYAAAKKQNLTIHHLIRLMSITVLVPVLFIGFLAVLLNSPMGDRLVAFAHWDQSANSRLMIIHVFDHLSTEEIFFGITAQRAVAIAANLSTAYDVSAIENPWLLMFILLGALAFCIWLPVTLYFLYRLMRCQPFTLQLAVIAYITIASTFNSFGVKDSTYLIMVSIVTCATQTLSMQRQTDAHKLAQHGPA